MPFHQFNDSISEQTMRGTVTKMSHIAAWLISAVHLTRKIWKESAEKKKNWVQAVAETTIDDSVSIWYLWANQKKILSQIRRACINNFCEQLSHKLFTHKIFSINLFGFFFHVLGRALSCHSCFQRDRRWLAAKVFVTKSLQPSVFI